MRVILGLLLVFALFACGNLSDGAEVKKSRITVLPFRNSTSYAQGDVGTGLSDMLVTELIKMKRFIVYERERVQDILREQDFGVSGRVDPSTAARIGRIVGVDEIVIGNVTQYGIEQRMFGTLVTYLATVSIDVRLVDAETGEVLLSATAGGRSTRDVMYEYDQYGQLRPVMGTTDISPVIFSEASRYAIDDIATKIHNLFPLEGYIVSRERETALIDLGANIDVRKDDRFTVYRIGKGIVHPITGEILGAEKTAVGEVKVRRVLDNRLSEVLLMKGVREIRPGDLIVSQPREIRTQTRTERRRRDRRR